MTDYASISVECSGATSVLDIDFDIKNENDFLVLGVVDGTLQKNITYSWNSLSNKLTLNNPRNDSGAWTAYVFRAEAAISNLVLTTQGTVAMSAILGQFEKDNRVLQQLQNDQSNTLRAPDSLECVPTKNSRKGKVLSFDSDGAPITVVAQEDVENIKAYKNSAQTANNQAQAAKTQAEGLKSDVETLKAQTNTIKTETAALVDGFDDDVSSATDTFNANTDTKTSAFNSNAATKTDAFDTNAQSKTTDFNTNATTKTNTFNSNAISKTGTFDTNASAKTTDFNANYTTKKSAIDDVASSVNSAVSDAQTAKTLAETAKADAVTAKTAAEVAAAQAGNAITNEVATITAAKDSALSDITTSKNSALADITVYTDPDGRISALEKSKSSAGKLYFNGGYLTSPAGALITTLPISICVTYTVAAWDNPTTTANLLCIASNNNASSGVAIWQSHGTAKFVDLLIQSAGNGQMRVRLYNGVQLPTGSHTICVCISDVITSGKAAFKWYVDGVEQTQGLAYIGTQSLASTSISGASNVILGNNNYPQTTTASSQKWALARMLICNFDISATGAPYSVDDYNIGNLPPPALASTTASQRLLLALDDYTIAVGSTRYVPDVSGNSNDATVSGGVNGDRDVAIARLCALINANNS